MDWRSKHADKLISGADAARKVRSGDSVYLGPFTSNPETLATALFARKDDLRNVTILPLHLALPLGHARDSGRVQALYRLHDARRSEPGPGRDGRVHPGRQLPRKSHRLRRTRVYSGPGGQTVFAVAASYSEGGSSIIALPSSSLAGSDRHSRVLPQLPAGSVVTTQCTFVDFVVTEYGIAPLRGKTVKQRAEEVISVAHPDFRPDLRRQAVDLHHT